MSESTPMSNNCRHVPMCINSEEKRAWEKDLTKLEHKMTSVKTYSDVMN